MSNSNSNNSNNNFVFRDSMMATSVHCTCCHVCHVSMKQRPRQLLACAACNTIICRTCLETRWKTDQWAEGCLEDQWVCHKCRGDCPCKACRGKGGAAVASRKRANSISGGFSSNSAEDRKDEEFAGPEAMQMGDDESQLLALATPAFAFADVPAPAPRPVKRHHAAAAPGRQPSLPPGFQVTSSHAPAVAFVPRERMGLGHVVLDSATPVHMKVIELSRQRDVCDANIASMRALLSMLEQERTVLDRALNQLVTETAQTVGGELRRSKSQAQLLRSSSHCNLEDLASMTQTSSPMKKSAQDNVC